MNEKIGIDKEAVVFCVKKAVMETAEKICGRVSKELLVKVLADEASERVWKMLRQLSDEEQALRADEKAAEAAEEERQENLREEIIRRLWKAAKYAADSYSLELMYQAYGELNMAVFSGMVKYEQVRDISEYITALHLNDGAWRRMCENREQ